ncbi:SGNH/GDSL hydrolase family protein [Klebsiella pneumoniae]|uniref:SGNH/GDSL hydrolase family protein n=2 Tax=Klebsiella pneumoniae TaxID=573 RepID=UPI001083AA15|nr:SGNH/GDSL hydrolase family protein [Klebsiella pneumoniae]EKV1079451.1 SGNH/GDSL hydrolase family protein [Klebsiella pneumoniae]EKV3469855.1 SGNH/GDSL hydrolase family protein [Klebsiella pneumoniae]EKV6926883.1 SGNH/GDSL hydrolase family protein [Klebsiella pneumoniae]EKV8487077.1 SGNH/GDSL hydrolase family protein [Klebsiella pneumoniae]VGH68903.1 flagellar biosynthesis, cell-distal portion of basal-body rod [Klebsiella pneumoniae]
MAELNPPLGTTTPEIFLDNVKRADELVNGPAGTVNDRAGEPLDTWRQMMAKNDEVRQNLIPLSKQYQTLAAAQADIANIPEGSTAYYRSPDDSALAIEVMNVGGTLQPTGRKMPSQQAVDEASDSAKEALERVPEEKVMPALVPVVHDMAGNVPIYLENGELDAKAVTGSFSDKVAGKGTVIPTLAEMVQKEKISPQLVPLFKDDAGMVPVYLVDGRLAVKGIDSSFVDLVYAALIGLFQPNQKYTDARTAWRWRTAKTKYKLSVTSKLKVGFTGDSWTEKKAIPQMMANILYSEYSKAGEGWINFASANGDTLNGMSFNISGWTTYDASETTAAPTYGCALDGLRLYATGTAARITLNAVSATGLSIYYKDTTGTFRYTIDGGTPIVVTGAGTGNVTKVDITGLANGTHQLVIDLTGNADTAVIYGVYATISSTGVEIQKFGNANITADGYTKVLGNISYFAQQLNPDIIFMIIGTNDYRLGRTLSNFYTALTSWVQAYKAALPDTALVLIAPPQCNASGSYPLSSYRDVMRQVANENHVEFFSLYDDFPAAYATANTYGLWNDALHLNNNGADFLSRQLYKYFL